MRFDSFQLTRFGHFTDQVLAFPAPDQGRPDLHIVAGVNEAGKSTFRAAVSELLFGFDARTPYDFRHAYPDLLLCAEIRNDGQAESIQRTKKRSHSLSRADGGALADSHLAHLLGGLDKAAYARELALDHGMLVAGGKRLLESRSDLSQIFFEAASGIAELAALQRTLDEQAGRLWKNDGRAKTAYREAARALDQANRSKRAAVTTSGSYGKLRHGFETAGKSRDAAREASMALERERSGLERLRLIGPLIAKLDGLALEIARQSPPDAAAPRLPAGAAEQLENIRRREAVLRALIERKAGEHESLRAKLDALSLDQAASSRARAIEALAEQRARVEQLPLDIEHRRRELASLERQALDQARHIGWSCESRATLQDRLPAALHRNELRGALQQRPTLEERLASRRGAAGDLEDDLAGLRAKLAALPSGDPARALVEAIEQARRLGDVEPQRRDLARSLQQAEDALEALRPALASWSGDWPALAQLDVIPPGQAEERLRADADLANRLTGQEARDKEIGDKLQVAEAGLEAKRRQHEIVDRAALRRARAERDDLWRDIKLGKAQPSEVAERYEQQVDTADSLADRRFETAEAISQTDQLITEVATLGANLRIAQADRDRLRAEINQRASGWSQSMAALGLGELRPEGYRAWLEVRGQALQGLAQRDRAEAELQSFGQRCAAAAGDLRDALDADGWAAGDQRPKDLGTKDLGAKDLGPKDLGPKDLDGLLRRAAARVEDAQRVAGERKQGGEAQQELARRLDRARKDLRDAERQWQDWSQAWAEGLAACGLPPACGPEAAGDALDRMDEIEAFLVQIERLETDRIAKMRDALESFAQATARLAGEVDPALPMDDANAASRALSGRLAEARDAESRHQELTGQLDRVERDRAEAKAGLDGLLAELAPLVADAALADPADLEGLASAIKASDRLRDLESQHDAVRGELLAAADGAPVEDLRRALAESPAEERAVRLDELAREQADARQALEDSSERWAEARAALGAVGAGDSFGSAAARAEEDRQGAIAELTTVAGDYIGAYLKAKLLRWAIDRYSAEFQSPLLAGASALFRTLTLGRYEALVVDLDPDAPTLHVRTAGGDLIGLEGLSDGTRDQLYMALRIAAVELHLEQAPALPFIADDLLINFDNDRAAAAFQVLAALGRRTQVLYLSHHDHLVELARATLGPDLNVVRL